VTCFRASATDGHSTIIMEPSSFSVDGRCRGGFNRYGAFRLPIWAPTDRSKDDGTLADAGSAFGGGSWCFNEISRGDCWRNRMRFPEVERKVDLYTLRYAEDDARNTRRETSSHPAPRCRARLISLQLEQTHRLFRSLNASMNMIFRFSYARVAQRSTSRRKTATIIVSKNS
jgi:hypothetical protein